MASRTVSLPAGSRMSRHAAGWAVAASLTLLTSGCIGADSPVGSAAVYVNDAGQVSVTVESCGEEVTAVQLERVDVSASGATVGQWTAARQDANPDFAFSNPPITWNVDQDPGELDSSGTYSVRADTINYITGPTEFNPNDVMRLSPNEVLTGQGDVMRRSELSGEVC